ncbi:sialidase [Colwellia demingiae]|uniref:Sialidase n=1 Tax=Colwellia demingiae TaxID=89401 RepID=A0A5C6QGG0_9GAMM|nr:YCF48-related protein [Colwellia demingiae]TWX67949.1 sialidase [Colwellia demingiae]
MRIPYIDCGVMSLLFITFLGSFFNVAQANSSSDLLELPAKASALANKSVLMAMTPNNDAILVVGERGHIINWQNDDSWQQQQSPVSVAITDVTILSDGSKIAVGHDGVILKVDSNSTTWRKVFTGKEITQFKITQLKQQYQSLEQVILKAQDEDELEELTYQLDDLAFAIEDNQLELKSGPNKPLLSVARTSNDTLFATGAYGILLSSNDTGETWQLVSNQLDNPDSFHLNAVIATSDDQLYIVGENGTGFYSTDIGQTWSVMTLPYSGSLFGILANTINNPVTDKINSTKNKTQLVAFGLQGNIMVSLDGGGHWQHKKLPSSTSLLGGNFSKQGNAYLVGHGGVIVSFDPENLATLNIKKHPSGAALSSVVVKENLLILAGQFGISQWPIKEKE